MMKMYPQIVAYPKVGTRSAWDPRPFPERHPKYLECFLL